jgi:hypothetical protein
VQEPVDALALNRNAVRAVVLSATPLLPLATRDGEELVVGIDLHAILDEDALATARRGAPAKERSHHLGGMRLPVARGAVDGGPYRGILGLL